jgi:hypothetical protein
MTASVTAQPTVKGWLPIDLDFAALPPKVNWLYFGAEPLAEPFFCQTVERLRSTNPDIQHATTDLMAIRELAHRMPSAPPAGLIFHVSRCGSTLLSNAMRLAERTTVVSEAQPFSAIFPLGGSSGPPLAALLSVGDRKMLLDALASLFQSYAGHGANRLVIKFPSWNILFLELVHLIWPTTPCLIVIRDPVDVMVSNLLKPGGWLGMKQSVYARHLSGATADASDAGMGVEEYCARTLGQFYTSAARGLARNCRVVNYDDLSVDLARGVAGFFGLEFGRANAESLHTVFQIYSKDPTMARRHEDDRSRKREEANRLDIEALERWTSEPYNLLKRLSWR